MKDRVPLYPGRVTLTPVSGQANTFDLTRADQPTQEGTPLNKESLLKDTTAALYGKTAEAVPDDLLSVLSKSVLEQVDGNYTKHTGTYADLSVGSTMMLNVGGTPYEFIVVQQGKPSSMYDDSCSGTWLLMKDCYSQRVWDAGKSNIYELSDVDTWLSNDFLGLLDNSVQSIIKQVKIPYRQNGGYGTDQSGANGLSRKAFLLGGYEVGYTTSDNSTLPVDGAKLAYFESGAGTSAKNKRIATLNGSAALWWLRSPRTSSSSNAGIIDAYGNLSNFNAYESHGIRPCIILPSDVKFVYYTDEAGNVYPGQGVDTQITDVLGNLIAIPAGQIKDGVKIATGSYTGTGTYGESNPNSLTFEFEPKLVFIFVHPYSSSSADNVIIPAISLDNVYRNGGYLYGSLRNSSNCYAKIDGNTVYWYYSMSGAAAQMNERGWKHSYIAIG